MDSNDSQPTTRNPQQDVGGGLQPISPDLQPLKNENGSDLNPNALPKTDNLRVSDKNQTGTIQVTSSPGNAIPPGGGTSLWVFSAVSLILALILLAMAKVARPVGESANSMDSKKNTTKGAVQKDKVLASKSETVKSIAKKKSKKSAKKKKKK